MLILCLLPGRSPAAVGEDPEDQYLRIFKIIDEANGLNTSGKTKEAREKYVQAQAELVALKKSRPNWNTKAVAYRLTYVTDKLAELSAKPVVTETSSGSAATAANGPQIKLLEAGAEPRKALRFHPVIDQKQAGTITGDLAMSGGGRSQKMPTRLIKVTAVPKTVSTNVGSPGTELEFAL